MNYDQIIDHLDTLPITHALWWFIENVAEDSPHRTPLFFYLRSRFRVYQENPKGEQRYEDQWRKLKESA